jgi:hypothetical protein
MNQNERSCIDLELLDAKIAEFRNVLAPLVEELAQKSASGTLSPEDLAEYERIVRLNDVMSEMMLECAPDDFWQFMEETRGKLPADSLDEP